MPRPKERPLTDEELRPLLEKIHHTDHLAAVGRITEEERKRRIRLLVPDIGELEHGPRGRVRDSLKDHA